MKLLIVRLEWMQYYQGDEPLVRAIGAWGRGGHPINEANNFLVRDGTYYGNWRVGEASNGDPARLSLSGFDPRDDKATGITVAFVAKNPEENENVLVGFYRNATVYQDRQNKKFDDGRYRATAAASDGFLIPVAERSYRYPFRAKSKWFTYGRLNEQADLALLTYIDNLAEGSTPSSNKKLTEWRRRRLAIRLERYQSASLRDLKLKSDEDFCCSVCRIRQMPEDHVSLKRRFEVHHLEAFKLLEDGQIREVVADDLVVLCANCHRAIHAPGNEDYVSNVEAFRSEIIGQKA